ncbi:MAG: RAD55 family ATPase, partial [Thermoplasmata archaeon]|nr:RAD55 family ATPase [Thermoplasmata archaeon]
RRIADREPSGTPRLDDLLQGGVPPRGQVLVVGDAFVGKEIVLYAFLAEGLKNGEPAIVVTTSRGPDEVGQQIGLVSPQFREYEQLGKVHWIDASHSAAGPGAPASAAREHTTTVNGPDDHAGILRALVAAARQAEGIGSKFRVAYFGLSSSLAHADDRAAMVFLQNFVGILKPRASLAMYSLDAGALSDAQSEQILSRMDGSIRFKQERDKTFLAVAGFGEVATREWIECRATNRTLVIGSFSLERIR